MMSLEESIVVDDPALDGTKVFSNESVKTEAQKSSMSPVTNFRAYPYSYSRCFNMVFALFALLGLIGGMVSAEFAFGLMDWLAH